MTPEQSMYQPPMPQAPQIAEDPETIRRRKLMAMALRNQGQQGAQGNQSTLGMLASGIAQVGGGYLAGKANRDYP